MNNVALIGRLTADPEVRYQQDTGKPIGRYTLAVDRQIKRDNQPTADFIRCVVFNAGAEFAQKYLHKGMKIAVLGRIQTGSYKNSDGQTVYTTDVIVNSQEFCEKKTESETAADSVNTRHAPVSEDGFMSIPDGIDEELPFS